MPPGRSEGRDGFLEATLSDGDDLGNPAKKGILKALAQRQREREGFTSPPRSHRTASQPSGCLSGKKLHHNIHSQTFSLNSHPSLPPDYIRTTTPSEASVALNPPTPANSA